MSTDRHWRYMSCLTTRFSVLRLFCVLSRKALRPILCCQYLCVSTILDSGGERCSRINLFNHPLHASSTEFFTPRNVGVFFLVNTRSEMLPPLEAVIPTADERAWHRSLEASDSSASNNGGLAGIELSVLKQITLFSKADAF